MRQQTVVHRASERIRSGAPCPPKELNCLPILHSFADPDAALVEALKAQTANAFDELVKRHGRRLLMVAMKITNNRQDAEDVVQESYLKVFKKIDSFRGDSKFYSWMTRIVINQALMLIRANTQHFVSIDEGMEADDKGRRPEITACSYTPEQVFAQCEFEAVTLNLENVREASRRVMELRLRHDLSENEIAQALSLTSSAVKARLYRGRVDLRKAMSRRLHSEKLTRAHVKMHSTIGGRKQTRRFISANRLAGDSPSPAQYGQSPSGLQSSLPYHLAPQLLAIPLPSSARRPADCL